LKKIVFGAVALMLITVLILSGCTRPQSSSTLSAPGQPSVSGGVTTSPSAPSGNGVLNLSDIDPITLDPALAAEIQSSQYIMQIFSGLAQMDDKQQPAPDIAQSWDISQDGMTYTFHLRHDVKFQDGKPLTAGDFKYSWERAANPATNSLTTGTYLGDIVGVKEMLAGKANSISGVKAVDDYTLQVTIDSPKSYFLSKMTYPTSFVVDSKTVASGSNWWRTKPNGTGPFKLGSWTQNKSLTLQRNSLYYGTPPQLSQVNYQYYSGLPMDLYEMGQVDATGVSVDYLDKVTDKAGPFASQLAITPEYSFSYVGFNCAQPPFDDPNIRKAFSLAIDKDKLVSLVFRNTVQKADGILPPGMPGYNSNLSGISFDVAQAQALIKASKYGDVSKLPSITLTTSGYGGAVGSYLQALVYQWKQNLGVDVKVRQLEPDRYLYNLKTELDQMFDMGWVADYPHPQDFLDILFSTGADNNYGGYSNAQADSLIQQANRTLDQGQSFPLYQQAEQIIVNDAGCLPLFFGKNYTLSKPYVKGYVASPIGINFLKNVSVSSH
jgi:oligopeptide transport system substrate-binding protein